MLARFWCARRVWSSCGGNGNHNNVLERPVKLFQISSKVFRVCIQQALESRVCCLSFFSSLFSLPSSILFPLLSLSALQSPHVILYLSIPSSLWMSEQVTEYRSHTYSMRRLCVFLDRSEEEGLWFTRLADSSQIGGWIEALIARGSMRVCTIHTDQNLNPLRMVNSKALASTIHPWKVTRAKLESGFGEI